MRAPQLQQVGCDSPAAMRARLNLDRSVLESAILNMQRDPVILPRSIGDGC